MQLEVFFTGIGCVAYDNMYRNVIHGLFQTECITSTEDAVDSK